LVKKSLHLTPGIEPLYGTRDENLRLMEDGLKVQIDLRADSIQLMGEAMAVARVEGIFSDFEHLRKLGVHPHNGELNALLKMVVADPAVTLRGLVESGKQRAIGTKRAVQPRSPNQRKYVESIETYLAVAMAVSALLAKKVARIILVRPAVEAGERLGFLPGDLMAKVDPYLRPLYDALYDMMGTEGGRRLLEAGAVEVAPLAYMRGRTLNQSFIILDEAQNTTPEQMKMFLTRIGFGSKMVVTGDDTQIDLPGGRSGLLNLEPVLVGVPDLAWVHLGRRDVVRHRIVQDIVTAYESAAASKA
jgi:phosphate starvation-inducible PhoH-like protein